MPRERANTKTGVQFTRQSAAEIAEVIRAARGGDRGQLPARLPRAAGGGASIVRGTFLGMWDKGQSAVVTVAGSGTTVTAKNYFAKVGGSGTTTRACAVASVGGEWILIAAEC